MIFNFDLILGKVFGKVIKKRTRLMHAVNDRYQRGNDNFLRITAPYYVCSN